MELVLATQNPHKTREFSETLGKDFNLIDLTNFSGIELPIESGNSFEENAKLKALGVSKDRQLHAFFVIADDSGLEVDALGGTPGIYSARYAGKRATDKENVAKLLSELRDRTIARERRSARFRCVIALAQRGKVLGTFEGIVEGQIVDPPRGRNGFGYDPIFQPNGLQPTFAEMPAGSKNKISHRAKAINALREGLASLGN
jgi:XTP/dITP diphosphohydrolase